jgi:hypothetical protein
MSEPLQSRASETPASRRPLIILMLLFVVPLSIAFLLYYGELWRPASSTEHGDLIHPARPLPELALAKAEGGMTEPDLFRKRWSLVFIGDGRCNDRCRAALADMQRARELLGKDISRVQSVFLASEQCCALDYLRSTYPQLIAARLDSDHAAALASFFPEYAGVPLREAGRIYIVDPLGNLMMSYPQDASGIGMYEDLKTLLKLSHIG